MDNIALYLLDLVQNSIEAQAKHIELHVVEEDYLEISLLDDGTGMDLETLQNASSPFFTTRKTRRVGLGLSMIKMLTEQTSGTFELTSQINSGTKLFVTCDHHHIDMPPLGDFGDMIVTIAIHQNIGEFEFTFKHNEYQWIFKLSHYKKMLGETLYDVKVMTYLKDYINQEIEKIRGAK